MSSKAGFTLEKVRIFENASQKGKGQHLKRKNLLDSKTCSAYADRPLFDDLDIVSLSHVHVGLECSNQNTILV